MRKFSAFLLAFIICAVIHEGIHALMATAFNEYQDFRVHPYGLEVVYKTPSRKEQVSSGVSSPE